MHREEGFSLVGVVIIGVVIAIIGGAAFVLLNLSDDGVTPTPSPSTNNTTPADSNTTITPIPGLESGKLAFTRNNDLWVYTNNTENQLTTDGTVADIPYQSGMPDVWYSHPQLSPNGEMIAFFKNSGSTTRALYLINTDGTNERKLVSDTSWYFPIIRWAPTSENLYYLTDATEINRVNVSTGKVEALGSFVVTTGCGGASSDVAAHLSAEERLLQIGGNLTWFEISPNEQYVIHSSSHCESGLNVYNLHTQTDTNLDGTANIGKIAPGGTTIALISSGNNITIWDYTVPKLLQTINLELTPDMISWSETGATLYYTTHELTEPLTFADEVAFNLFGNKDVIYEKNRATLWALDINSGDSAQITQYEAYRLRPIYVNETDSIVILAEVENPTEFHAHATVETTRKDLVPYYPRVNVKQIDLNTGSVQSAVNNAQQAVFVE